MSATGEHSTGADKNPPIEAPQVSMVVQVSRAAPSFPANIITGTLQGILDFTNTHVWVFADDGYESQESVLYRKFIYIEEWCQLKAKIPTSCAGVYYGDRKIKFLQALAWWVTYLTLWGKIIYINNF